MHCSCVVCQCIIYRDEQAMQLPVATLDEQTMQVPVAILDEQEFDKLPADLH